MDRLMNRDLKFIFIALIGLFGTLGGFIEDAPAKSPYYYTISYATPEWGCGIKVSKINLDTKEVVNFDTAGLCHIISFETPIIFNRNDSDFIFASTMNCGWGKRTPASNECYSDYVIFYENGKEFKKGRLPNIFFCEHDFMKGNTIPIRYLFNTDSGLIDWHGLISLKPDNTIDIIPQKLSDYSDSTYPIISGFQYFHKIDERNDSIYWDIGHNANYLLRIDVNKKVLLDSLRIPDKRSHSCLFALSEDYSRIYTFHFFAQYEHTYYENGPPPFLPSYIKVYRADTLVLLDSFPVPAPSMAKGYVAAEWASAKRINDYIVYYFFQDEGIEFFDPAMLYIFDTRNNESTWLNIGWR
jgi:hypothetical protein